MIPFTEEHSDIREMVGDFSDNELAPKAEHLNESCEFPQDIIAQLAELGILGAPVPEDFGGLDGDVLTTSLMVEELARNCGSTASIAFTHLLTTRLVAEHASDEQKQAWLPGLATGEMLGTYAVCEPGRSGDVTLTECSAEADGDSFKLSGEKSLVLAGAQSKLMLVVAKAGDDLALFAVDGAEAAGVEVSTEEATLGLRGAGMAMVKFDGASAQRVGDVSAVDRVLELSMIGVSAMVTGLARGAGAYAVQYASERQAFGRSIDRFEALQLKIAESEAGFLSSQLLCYRAAVAANDKSAKREAEIARFHNTKAALLSAKESTQILGGNGYSREYPVERAYRDIASLSVLQGSNDSHRLSLARTVIGVDR